MILSTSSVPLAVLDTNVVVYAHDQESPHHAVTSQLLRSAEAATANLCVTPQILSEFYAVITSPKRVTRPRSPEEALAAIERVLAYPGMTLLPTPADLVKRWMDLVRSHPVTRQHVFDVQLVATMLGNGVRRIYTFNRGDFERFEQIDVLSPR